MIKEEYFSTISHGIGAIAALIGTIVLTVNTRPQYPLVWLSLLYGFCITFLFSASTIYHFLKKEENQENFWRKLDHIAIFFMIAGTFTPLCSVYLPGPLKWSIISLQWFLVFSGIFFKFFYVNAPRFLSAGIYLFMGWIALVPIYWLVKVMSPLQFIFLCSGGVAFTVGAIIYGLKKPDPIPGLFGFHEIFHIFIVLGGALHFAMVYMTMV
jgi:hemolysin III